MTNEEALRITNDSIEQGRVTNEMESYHYMLKVREALEKADKADRPKGKWINNPEDPEWDICTACGIGTKRREITEDCFREYGYIFCPHCGADVRGYVTEIEI